MSLDSETGSENGRDPPTDTGHLAPQSPDDEYGLDPFGDLSEQDLRHLEREPGIGGHIGKRNRDEPTQEGPRKRLNRLQGGRAPEANGSRSEHTTGLLDPRLLERLAPELVEQVGTHMVTDDVRATARNIDGFRTYSPYARAVAEKSPQLKRVQARTDELRSFANDLHAAVVKEDLPSVQSETYGEPREGHPVPARDHVRAVGPILKLQSWAENSVLVTKILAIPDSVARSETIRAMTPYFDDIAENDRSLLIKDAIKTLGDRGHPLTKADFEAFGSEGYPIDTEGRREAADVIVESKARGYLTKEHLSDYFNLTSNWPELSDLIAQREKSRQGSIRTKVRGAGPNVTAAGVLRSDNSALKAHDTSYLMKHFEEIESHIRSGLIDNAITTFGRADVPLEMGGRSSAANVIVEARAKGYLTNEQQLELNNLTRDNGQLREVLSERTMNYKKYAIDKASDTEIQNLRKTFNEVENSVAPTLEEDARLPAEHARMNSLKEVSSAVAKASTMLRQELIDTNRDRASRVR